MLCQGLNPLLFVKLLLTGCLESWVLLGIRKVQCQVSDDLVDGIKLVVKLPFLFL